jgi:hypothetical protein
MLRVLFQQVLPRLALLYVLMGCSVEWLNNQLIYYPDKDVDATPRSAHLAYEDVTLTTSDGLKLGAWYVPAEGAAGTVIFCHGNAGNIANRLDIIALLHRAGVNVLIFDYRGYGRSEGKPSEAGTYADAEAAWAYLVDQRDQKPDRIVIHGESLGGSVAAHLASRHTPAGLVCESTFSDIGELGQQLYPWLPVRWLLRVKYATAEYVHAAKCPVMVIHSRQDDMIPFRHGEAVFAAATGPKRFLVIRGPHNGGMLESRDIYEPALRDFLREVLPFPSGKKPGEGVRS